MVQTTGSLTISVKTGESILISIPGKEPVLVYLARVDDHNRASLNIRAPREYRIDRLPDSVRLK